MVHAGSRACDHFPLALQHGCTTDFYTLQSSLCSSCIYFSPWQCLSLLTPYALAWFSSTPCVSIWPLCAPQLPQNIHVLPTFSPRGFPSPSLPTSCSPICSKKTGHLSCLLVSVFSLFLLPAVSVGSLICLSCDLQYYMEAKRISTQCSSCLTFLQHQRPRGFH